MKFGLTIFPTDYSIHPRSSPSPSSSVASSRSGSPSTRTSRSRDHPGRNEGGLAAEYYDVIDPFVALAWRRRRRARCSSAPASASWCSVTPSSSPNRWRASTCSLQDASNSGWGPAGTRLRSPITAPSSRGAWSVMRERMEAMKLIWTEEKAEYHGNHVTSTRLSLAEAPPEAAPADPRRSEHAEAIPPYSVVWRRLVPHRPGRPGGRGDREAPGAAREARGRRPRPRDGRDVDLHVSSRGERRAQVRPGRRHAGHLRARIQAPRHRPRRLIVSPGSRPAAKASSL